MFKPTKADLQSQIRRLEEHVRILAELFRSTRDRVARIEDRHNLLARYLDVSMRTTPAKTEYVPTKEKPIE